MKKLNLLSVLLMFLVFGCNEQQVEQDIKIDEGISVSPWEIPTAFEINETLQFIAYNISDYEEATGIVWSVVSPDGAVEVEEETGIVTGTKEGWGKVIATSSITNLSDTTYVVVGHENPSVDFLEPVIQELEVVVGRSIQVEAMTLPYNVSDLGLIWYEADEPEMINVESHGLVKAKVVGVTNVLAHTIRTEDREVLTTSIRLNVMPEIAVDTILFAEDVITQTETEEFGIAFNYLPENANDTTFHYYVSDTSILEINEETGLILAKKPGSALAFVSNDRILSKAVKVTVNEKVFAQGVELNYLLAGPIQFTGQSVQIEANFTPEETFDQTGVWTSSNELVASVDQGGVVTAVSDGTTIIKFVSNDGGFTDEVEVTVDATYYYFAAGETNNEVSVRPRKDLSIEEIVGTNHANEEVDLIQLTRVAGDGWPLYDISTQNSAIVNSDYGLEYSLWAKAIKADEKLSHYNISLILKSSSSGVRVKKVVEVKEPIFNEWTEYKFNFDDTEAINEDIDQMELIFWDGHFGDTTLNAQYIIEGLTGPRLR
ncbi:Ig-like domain-containing protein [Flammeovirga agarivorans]|uniref:BIG2 domain-containing protein n=1 Tax=Flammeovirga agarivorans TaxID=2726742 RepID=A0A7X8SN78_9BACT|nr:Ig-like domain-containing protein [Flammeovirga agarivorans]NLR93314.1 hypothetical protein [Flammeovirga agarivorans]